MDLPPTQSVLVVDDDADLRTVVRDALQDEGYLVYEAPDGQSALERLRSSPHALVVLLDWMMPGVDGIQVLQALLADAPPATHHAYIFMTAAMNRAPLKRIAEHAEYSVSILPKPFELDQLLAAVAAAALKTAI